MKYFVDGLTPAQIKTFEKLAIGNDNFINPRIADKLMEKGLVERYYQPSGRGSFRVIRYAVPIHIHAQWCEWCSKNVTDPESTELTKEG